jgi:sigma-E factor negative regulatory protein RseC
MLGQNLIDHEGIIEWIDHDVARVKIRSESACASCHAKGICGAADQEDKYLEIAVHGNGFTPGEQVLVQVSRHLGFRAVALGYILPFLLLMSVLITLTFTGAGEFKAGLGALISLLPYYLALYIFRKRLDTAFTFSIKKLNSIYGS